MKILNINHNNLSYEFRYLELSDVIEVIKEDEFTYLITSSPKSLRCNCPGATYHGHCWHLSVISKLLSQPSIKEPWAEWVEEAGMMIRERRGNKIH